MIAYPKKLSLIFLVLSTSFFMSACNKKPTVKGCKVDAECRMDASGNPQHGVCHMGKCEECVENTDCTGLEQCINFRCHKSCVIDSDCNAGQHCENGICYDDCLSNDACSENQICDQGRCMMQTSYDDNNSCEGIARIHFDFDRYEIKDSDREQVEKLATCLAQNPARSLLIEGHTDARGTPTYNAALGERRAIAVRNFLLSKGIGAHRLNTVSYGEQKPLVDEKNNYAWQQNRRAEWKY